MCYAECCYSVCRYAECRYAECRYAECRYTECRGTIGIHKILQLGCNFFIGVKANCNKTLLI